MFLNVYDFEFDDDRELSCTAYPHSKHLFSAPFVLCAVPLLTVSSVHTHLHRGSWTLADLAE